mgnify:FL=1
MRFKRCIFILMSLVGILLLPGSVQALDLKLTYNETWNGCFDQVIVLPSYDNNGDIDGYLYLTNNGITKQALDNNIVYENKIRDVSNIDVSIIDSSNSDGYVVKGESDFLITSYDDNDNVVFQKQYGGDGIDVVEGLIPSYSNKGILDGYLILVITTSSDLGVEQGCALLKINLTGDIVWLKDFNENLRLDVLLYAKNQSIYGISVTNKTKLTSEDLFTNDVVWEKDTGIKIKNINYSYDKNGKIDGVVVVGYVSDNINVGTIAKYDLAGNLVFKSNYDLSTVDSMYTDVISSYLPDRTYDGYIVTAISSDNRTFLVKYDLNGTKVYEKVYSNKSNIIFTIVNNFDSAGRQNGYLLYSSGFVSSDPTPVSLDEQIQTYGSCDHLVVAKYTYDIFSVAKEEVDGGTISVKSDAYPGEIVKVKVAVKEGYTLARIIVKDENGKEIEVNSDGTFVMPEGKVTVSAIYKRVTNPDTVSAAYMVLGVVLLIAVGSLIVIKQNNKKNN